MHVPGVACTHDNQAPARATIAVLDTATSQNFFFSNANVACRLFGLLGAGATAGQLAGSAAAGLAAATAHHVPALATALPPLLMLGDYKDA